MSMRKSKYLELLIGKFQLIVFCVVSKKYLIYSLLLAAADVDSCEKFMNEIREMYEFQR